MTNILHILFDGPDDAIAQRMIQEHGKNSELEVSVADMSGDAACSADELVDKIFAADKVISWHIRI